MGKHVKDAVEHLSKQIERRRVRCYREIEIAIMLIDRPDITKCGQTINIAADFEELSRTFKNLSDRCSILARNIVFLTEEQV